MPWTQRLLSVKELSNIISSKNKVLVRTEESIKLQYWQTLPRVRAVKFNNLKIILWKESWLNWRLLIMCFGRTALTVCYIHTDPNTFNPASKKNTSLCQRQHQLSTTFKFAFFKLQYTGNSLDSELWFNVNIKTKLTLHCICLIIHNSWQHIIPRKQLFS